MSMTICYSAFTGKGLPIQAFRDNRPFVEPTCDWNSKTLQYDTQSVRSQLGATENRESLTMRASSLSTQVRLGICTDPAGQRRS